MKAALIPAFGYEETALQSNIHLVLPLPDCVANSNYMETYQYARARGDYIILDNGAAEGNLQSVETIVHYAKIMRAHEVVAPDILGVMHDTKWLVSKFLKKLRELKEVEEVPEFKIQAVLQGQDSTERWKLLEYYARHDEIKVIGIPKVSVQVKGDDVRARIAQTIQYRFPGRFELHLLGASPFFPSELRDIDFPPGIRSTDSALPYKLAAYGIPMDRPHHVKRWTTYFAEKMNMSDELLKHNLAIYTGWAARHEG